MEIHAASLRAGSGLDLPPLTPRAPMHSPRNRNEAVASAFVEELARSGIRHACAAPGSRSTPLILALHAEAGIRLWTHLDERSMAFFALGLAKTLREPVAIACTSGTAAANFLPAVAEARGARVPLVVLTADRPPEATRWGAHQTMDQTGLYGSFVKWAETQPTPETTPAVLRHARASACRAAAAARSGVPGPVHVNFPFREPLAPIAVPDDVPEGWTGPAARPDARPFLSDRVVRRLPDPAELARFLEETRGAEKGLIVCGPQEDEGFPAAVSRLAAAFAFPILADPLSGLRCGPHDRSFVVDSYDAFLREEAAWPRLAPDVILRFGSYPTSKPLMAFLETHAGARQVLVGEGTWRDPSHLAWDRFGCAERLFCEAAVAAGGIARADSDWTRLWTEAGRRTREAVRDRTAREAFLFEGRIFQELAEILPRDAVLLAGNSMPVRDLDGFFPSMDVPIRCMGNRGVNGIDGLVSTALGAAASGATVVAVLGDTAFYHDMNGLLAASRHGLKATFVVLNNDGGGIFSFLPQAADRETFEPLFAMPHGLTFGAAASLYGLLYQRIETWEGFADGMSKGLRAPVATILEVPGDRETNASLHRDVWDAGRAAFRGVL